MIHKKYLIAHKLQKRSSRKKVLVLNKTTVRVHMENIHDYNEDAYYYCTNKECVCNQKDEVEEEEYIS